MLIAWSCTLQRSRLGTVNERSFSKHKQEQMLYTAAAGKCTQPSATAAAGQRNEIAIDRMSDLQQKMDEAQLIAGHDDFATVTHGRD